MNTRNEENPDTDEFEPVELGSVTAETLGVPAEALEFQIHLNSRD